MPKIELTDEQKEQGSDQREEDVQEDSSFIVEKLEQLVCSLPITDIERQSFENDFMSLRPDAQQDLIAEHKTSLVKVLGDPPVYQLDKGDKRDLIYTNGYNEERNELVNKPDHLLRDEVIDSLSNNEQMNLYTRGSLLGCVIKDDDYYKWEQFETENYSSLISEGCAIVEYKGSKAARIIKVNGLEELRAKGQYLPHLLTPTPRHIRESVKSNKRNDAFRQLNLVLTYPYVHNDQLITEHGYNRSSGIFIPDTSNLEMKFPESGQEALDILRELLSGTVFIDESDFINAISLALTPIIRPNMGENLPPLFGIAAKSEGAGKSYLCQTLWSILQGSRPAVTELQSNSEAEMSKKLFSAILDASPYILFDNVDSKKEIDSGLLASFVTEYKRMERLFHTQKMKRIINYAVSCFTGNNTTASMELVDRICMIRLASPDDFNAMINYEFDPIEDKIKKDQPKYLGALVYLVKNWVDKDCPRVEGSIEGDFGVHRQHEWVEQINGIFEVNNIGREFLANTKAVRQELGSRQMTMVRFLNEAVRRHTAEKLMKPWPSKIVFDLASYADGDEQIDGNDMLGDFIDEINKNAKESSRRRYVGRILGEWSGKTIGGWFIHVDKNKNPHQFWLEDKGGYDKYLADLGREEREQTQQALERPIESTDEPVTRIDIEAEERAAMINESEQEEERDLIDEVPF